MYAKYFVFSLIASIIITILAARGPRDYVEPVSVTRTSIRPGLKVSTNNQTSGLNNTLRQSEETDEWEPQLCTNCLKDRYLAHYKARGCKQINHPHICKKPCPKYFECPKKDVGFAIEGCEHKGKVYKFGDRIEMDNPCKKGCFCDKYSDLKNKTIPEIRCAAVDCFNNFRAPLPNCFQVYEDDKCCSKEKCLSAEEITQQRKCLYNGKHYFLGQTIYPEEDPCVQCKCTEDWNQNNPVNSTGCKRTECEIRTDRKGCIPIYHDKVCCPIDYFCPPPEEEQCQFNGKTYLIGESLPIDKERTECKCVIPPDFTCIEKSQEVKPKTPEYIKKFQTLPKIKINESNDPFANVQPLIQVSKCPPFIPGGLTCAGVNCTTVIDQDGCQACKCQKECPQFKCKAGCTFSATTPGVCPQCNCG